MFGTNDDDRDDGDGTNLFGDVDGIKFLGDVACDAIPQEPKSTLVSITPLAPEFCCDEDGEDDDEEEEWGDMKLERNFA